MESASYNNTWRQIKNKALQSDCLLRTNDDYESICRNSYGISLNPTIVVYEEKEIRNKDLSIDIGSLGNSTFFNAVFKAIDIEVEAILNAYKQYYEYHNSAILNKIRKTVNKKIEKLNSDFNKMYCSESDQYIFTLDLDSSNISFGMARGKDEDPIMLEMQSTGFRWFFNLYFNFMCSNKLVRGDIVIMDEPATNLHVEGQKELRKFIKRFAIDNDLTFIIATHSPFLIDLNDYEDLRIVNMENNRAYIDNLFTAVNTNDPDTIIPIKEALTIKQNVIYDIDTEVIWVEGLTDYCYLTKFKEMKGIENIVFLPFNGVGKTDLDCETILKKITKIKFYKASLLVDGDKAGERMKKNCKETIFKDRVHTISEVGDGVIEIEDLFTENDKKKWGIEKKGEIQKKASSATQLKRIAKLEDFDDETIQNFEKLFALFE